MEDWADNESVTTDEDNINPRPKKNIHKRRWSLVSNEDGSLMIKGGRRCKEIDMPAMSAMFENQKSLAEADFVL